MQTLPVPDQTGGNHYGTGLQPWDLQIHMQPSCDVFIDARRTDVLEYVFRIKQEPRDETVWAAIKRDAIKAKHNLEAIIARCDQLDPPEMIATIEAFNQESQVEFEPSYQAKVVAWIYSCFGEAIADDKLERVFRFFEEASELAQAVGMTYSQAIDLVTYVWQRPVGEVEQETGGVMVTLAGLCHAMRISLDQCAEVELARVSTPEVMAKIKAKQAAKPEGVVSSLPGKFDPDKCTCIPGVHKCYYCQDTQNHVEPTTSY